MRQLRIAMVHGAADPARDGVADYLHRLVGALGTVRVDAVPVAIAPRVRPGARWEVPQWWRAAWRAAAAVRALQPDVVHIQFAPSAYRFSGAAGMLPLLLRRTAPLVTTLHEYGRPTAPPWWERATGWDRDSGRLIRDSRAVVVTNRVHAADVHARTGRTPVVVPLAPNVGDEIIASDVAARDDAGPVTAGPVTGSPVEMAIASRSVSAVPAGIGVSGHLPDRPLRATGNEPRPDPRARLGVPPRARLIAFFGFVHPVKGIRYLLAALPELRRRHPDVHLVVIGGFTSQALPPAQAEAFRAELSTLVARHGVGDAVTFTGYLPPDQVSATLRACEAAVLPFTEGVTTRSGALLTALAHGLPTAITAPPDPDPSLVDGQTVTLIPTRRDAATLAQTLDRLLRDELLRRRLAAGAGRFAREHRWSTVAVAHRALYDTLIDAQPRA